MFKMSLVIFRPNEFFHSSLVKAEVFDNRLQDWEQIFLNDEHCLKTIAAVFDSIGLTPFLENVKPSQLIWCFAK